MAVRPTPLPELSKLAPSVQAQVREAHAALVALIDRRADATERSQGTATWGGC